MELKHLTETFCNDGYPLAIIKYTMEKREGVSVIIPTTSRKVTYSITFKSHDFFSVLLAGMFGGYNDYFKPSICCREISNSEISQFLVIYI